ncbi:hypothetical protein EVAR_40557_1 [Eumeta japonica]|uniref:Uncharacterized protein n=1 Tax=Eumeta variegata TaxID=151549 RepID=A0A4C1VZ55_EUMVA|nr:hypothetical protein EVAR_40557_1 [Eumeta japonica]
MAAPPRSRRNGNSRSRFPPAPPPFSLSSHLQRPRRPTETDHARSVSVCLFSFFLVHNQQSPAHLPSQILSHFISTGLDPKPFQLVQCRTGGLTVHSPVDRIESDALRSEPEALNQ